MSQVPKVVISTIFHPKKEYAYKLFLDWANGVEYENLDFIIKVHFGEYGGDQGELKAIREQIRQEAVEADAAALLSVDIDTIGPTDAIQEFLDTPADMMTGIYFARQDADRAVCWKNGDPDQQFLNSEVYTKIDGAGMGFCFMRRNVLESISFDWAVPDDDYPAWSQAKAKGYRLLSLNLMRCRHYTTEEAYIYHGFGEINDVPTEEYEIQCPDGVTLNGVHHKRGKTIVDQKLIKEIKRLDSSYVKGGHIKHSHKIVSVIGKAQIGAIPSHTQVHKQGKSPAISKKKEVEIGLWKTSR